MRDGFLHHLGGLEHEGQDQLAGAKLVADLFHGRQQDGVEDLHGRGACWLCGPEAIAPDDLVDIGFHALLVAVEDAPVQALFGRHALQCGLAGRWFCPIPSAGALVEMLDQALEGVRAAVEDQVFGQLALFRGDLGVGVIWAGLTIAISSPAWTAW